MNLARRIIASLRGEAYLGQYLKGYEFPRYSFSEMLAEYQITVPPDAEVFADASFYQAGMDWSRYPHRAAILRIGQNIWKDSSFETFYAQAKQLGKKLGGYWFYDDRVSPDAQASVLISAMQGKTFELEILIDYERTFGGAYFGLKHLRRMMELVEVAGIKCKAVGTYSGYYFWRENTVGEEVHYPFFAARPLWLAWYASPSVVKVPAPWADWTHWQYGTPAVDWGQPTAEIDANRHNGTKAQFEERYGITAPSPGGNMKKGTIIVGGLNMRTGIGTNYNVITVLRLNDVVYGELDVASNWLNINKIERVDGTVENLTGWASANPLYMRLEDVLPPVQELPAYFIAYNSSNEPLGRYNKQ